MDAALLQFFYNQCGVRSTESKRIRQKYIKILVYGIFYQTQTARRFVHFFQIDVGCNEPMLRHEERVNHFASARHPTFVAGHRLSGAYLGPRAEQLRRSDEHTSDLQSLM